MADKSRKSIQFIPGWPNSHAPRNEPESTKTASIHEESLDLVSMNDLQQGELYIIKIKLIAIALFQGWDDEMCCFSILRTDLLEDLRWSEARYLPENFDAYLAFDYAGNPPIHLWTKHLRAVIPINWFNIFEEARHMQRQWNVSFWDPQANSTAVIGDQSAMDNNATYYNLTDAPITEIEDDENQHTVINEQAVYEEQEGQDDYDQNQDGTVIGNNEVALKENKYYSSSPQYKKKIMPGNNLDLLLSESPTNLDSPSYNNTPADIITPAMRLQKQYNSNSIVTRQQQKDLKQIEKQQQQTNLDNNNIVDTVVPNVTTTTSTVNKPKRPEIKQRRSFTSFFLKKKKSKKSLNSSTSEDNSDKRKSAPPTPSVNEKYYQKPSAIELSNKLNKEINKEVEPLPALTSSNNSSSTRNRASSSSSPTVKTPKNESNNDTNTTGNDNKLELFDIDSYFDMQATFAFLNSTNTNNFMDSNKKSALTTTAN